MNRISFALVVGMACFLSFLGLALHADPPALPQGPLLSPNPDFSAWKIDYSYGSDNDATHKPVPPPPLPPGNFSIRPIRSLTITWTKPLWHSVAIDTAGVRTEQWCDGTIRLFTENGSSPAFSTQTLGSSALAAKLFDFSSQKFPDMNWISPSTFAGTASVNGRSCIVFQQSGMQAWVDLQTRVPVQWKRGDETRVFQQLSSPGAPLTLPPDFGKIFAAIRHDYELLNRPVP
jgi:hypothetical protein